jgi:hypothetical protein
MRKAGGMPTTNPRVNAVLEPPLYEAVERLAKAEGISLSQKVRDLVREALELVEDEGWETIVAERKKKPGRFISHHEVKRRLGLI